MTTTPNYTIPPGSLLKSLLENRHMHETARCQALTSLVLTDWIAKGSWAPNQSPSFLAIETEATSRVCMRWAKAAFADDLPVREREPSDDPCPATIKNSVGDN